MTGWNPNFPCAQGLEWASGRQADRPITGRGPAGFAWSLESSVTEDVTNLWTFSSTDASNALDLIDIYDTSQLRNVPTIENVSPAGSNVISVISTGRDHTGAAFVSSTMTNFRFAAPPSGVTNMADVLGTFGNLIPAQYAARFVGDSGLVPQQTWLSEGLEGQIDVPHRTFLGFVPIGINQLFGGWRWGNRLRDTGYPFRVTGLDDGVTAGTTRCLGITTRVLAQKLVRGDQLSTFQNLPVRLTPFIIPSSTWPGSGRGAVFGRPTLISTAPEEYIQTFVVNPFTGLEWTSAELAAFGSTATNGTEARIGWRIQAVQTGLTGVQLYGRPAEGFRNREYGAQESVGGAIYAAEFRSLVVEDTREAYAYRAGDRTQKPGWNQWIVEAVGGGDWEKREGAEYLFHQIADEVAFGCSASARNLNIRVLSAGAGGARVPFRERVPTFSGTVPISIGEAKPWAPSVVLEVDV